MPTSINSLSIPSLCLKIIKDICFAGVGSWDESDPDEKTLKELRANFNKQKQADLSLFCVHFHG